MIGRRGIDHFASTVPVPFLNHISSFASALDVFPKGLVRCFGTTRRQPQTPPTRLPRAASRPRSDPAILSSSPLASSLIPAWLSCPAAGEKCLLVVIECPEGSVVSSVDGVLASVGPAQTCEEACSGDCCIDPGVCDGFTIRLCWDCESCFGEGACHDVSIDDVVLGCDGTEP